MPSNRAIRLVKGDVLHVCNKFALKAILVFFTDGHFSPYFHLVLCIYFQQKENTVKNPMIEIKYWLNNVCAHSPAEQRNIFLVGTHSGSALNGEQLSSDDLRKVHEVLEELIIKERFLERIIYDEKSVHCYFPVENSKTEGDRFYHFLLFNKLFLYRIKTRKWNCSSAEPHYRTGGKS